MRPGRITLFFACIIAALAVICAIFPSDGVTVGSHSFYLPTIHDLAEANRPTNEEDDQPVDTIPAEVVQLSDSITYLQTFSDSSDARFWLPDSLYFDSFWEIAENAVRQDRIVRVMHYGDSQIEMDRMTSQLRKYMQETFGGGGPGMIPYRTIIPTLAVSQSTSGELIHLSSFGDSTVTRSRGNYGPMMQSFRLNGESTLSIRASKHASVDNAVKQFSRLQLVFNNRGDDLSIVVDDKSIDSSYSSHINTQGVGSVTYSTSSPTTHFRLRTRGNVDLYCVTVDNGPGVAVDNIPMRGCSGSQFTLVNKEMLTQAYAQLDVAMIILQFGGNSVPYLKTNKAVSNYCTTIGKQIDYLHQCCPEAKILFIGPSDMSTSEKGKLQTYSMLPAIVDSLRTTAINHGAAFWSIYDAMGGWNSMLAWKKQGLAGSDYIHFTPKGAAMMGERLSTAFENSYRLFSMKRRLNARKK